jgi:hypothetical protein
MNKLSKQQNSLLINNTLPNTTSREIDIYNAYIVEKRLRNFSTREDIFLMNSLLVRWATYVGIAVPDATEIVMLYEFIKEHFPNFNATDIKECINLLANQTLDTDAEHYGKLSPIYVSKVLRAYQEHRNTIVFKVRDSIQKLKEAEIVPISDKERISNFKQLLAIAKKENLQGLTYIDAGDSLYNFIKFNKLMPITKDNIDQQLIDEAMEYGNKLYLADKKKKVTQTVIKNESFKKVADMQFEKSDIIRKYAREFVVNRFLLNLDLADILQKINMEMLKY